MTVGDDRVEFILGFLSLKDLYPLREVSKFMRKKSEAIFVQTFRMSISSDGPSTYDFGPTGPFEWFLGHKGYPSINYSRTENLEMKVCCQEHCELAFLEACKIPEIKKLKFEVCFRDCTRIHSGLLGWLLAFTDSQKKSIEQLHVIFPVMGHPKIYLDILGNCLTALQHLKSLQLHFNILDQQLWRFAHQPLDLSFICSSISPSIEHFSLRFNRKCFVGDFNSFPWQKLNSVSLSIISISSQTWTKILESLDVRDWTSRS
jgi:hypothetical protein